MWLDNLRWRFYRVVVQFVLVQWALWVLPIGVSSSDIYWHGGLRCFLARMVFIWHVTGMILPHLPPGGLPVPGLQFIASNGIAGAVAGGWASGGWRCCSGSSFGQWFVLRRCIALVRMHVIM